MKNIIIGFIAAVVVACVAYYGFLKSECPPCPECPPVGTEKAKTNRQALLSLADIALERKSKSQSAIELLVKFDKEFYMAFYKTKLGDDYFYSRHGSCCPCSEGGRGCCICIGGSAFGAPMTASLMSTSINSDASNTLYTLASYSPQQKPDAPKKLILDKKTIAETDVFTVPAGTAPDIYRVTFSGKINIAFDIDVRADGSFEALLDK